ncbi:MAG: hypothetical protein DME25_21105 [Verrucomicrobia bacterium]|nr:MAG: hypothetical protein DME25_21105 [Verrucomicrobiota bacterium]
MASPSTLRSSRPSPSSSAMTVLNRPSRAWTLVALAAQRLFPVSTVNVWDGQTVALGGLISENVTSIKDKVPVLGDLPFFGRFFRTESKNTSKKNLIIFITPTIIDPAGNPMHSEDEMPFAQSSIPPQPPGAFASDKKVVNQK